MAMMDKLQDVQNLVTLLTATPRIKCLVVCINTSFVIHCFANSIKGSVKTKQPNLNTMAAIQEL